MHDFTEKVFANEDISMTSHYRNVEKPFNMLEILVNVPTELSLISESVSCAVYTRIQKMHTKCIQTLQLSFWFIKSNSCTVVLGAP